VRALGESHLSGSVIRNIPITKKLTKNKILLVRKQKGIFQVLWERGFIDPININQKNDG